MNMAATAVRSPLPPRCTVAVHCLFVFVAPFNVNKHTTQTSNECNCSVMYYSLPILIVNNK